MQAKKASVLPPLETAAEVKSFQPLLVKAWNLCSVRSPESNAFSPEAVMRAASKRSGLSDFGNMDFLEGLNILTSSLHQYEAYHPFGRFYLRQMIIAMLVHRLRLISLLKRHPEIHQQDIARPVIILGLPRSGTTLLFNLLALDPTHRFMANWEAFIAQVPPQGDYSFARDPRRKQAKWMLRFQKYLMPDIDTMHAFVPGGAEECTPILMQSFATQAFAGGFNVPAFSSWLDSADHDPGYQHHKRVLQVLQWKYPGERWLLKSPDHLAAVNAILKTYPDACFVHIHRDPVKSVSSWASLNLIYRGVYYPSVDTDELGQQVLSRLANDMDSYMAQRRVHKAEQFYDLGYKKFLQDPIREVHSIYEQFGFELSQQAEDKMRRYLAANPKHKHGVHQYKPEDFGLTETLIRERFAHYIDTFIPPASPAGGA